MRKGRPGTLLFCDGPEDCTGGKTCCVGMPANLTFPVIAECDAPSECAEQGVAQYYLCHADSDCGRRQKCKPWDFAPDVKVCANANER